MVMHRKKRNTANAETNPQQAIEQYLNSLLR